MEKFSNHDKGNTQFKTLKDILSVCCEKYKDRPAFYEKADPDGGYGMVNYARFKRDVIGFGSALEEVLGIKGKKIVLIGENSYSWDVAYLAVVCGKNVIVPVDKDFSSREMINVINKSGAEAVIYSGKIKEKIDAIKGDLPKIRSYIVMKTNSTSQGEYNFDVLVSEGNELVGKGNCSYMEYEIDPDEFKILVFTSGTTSEPKGIMLSHRNVVENVLGIKKILDVKPGYKYFSILPSHHCYETITARMVQLFSGASVAYCEGKDKIVQNLREAKPTVMLTVPLISNAIHRQIIDGLRERGKEETVYMLIKLTDKLGQAGRPLKRLLFKEIHSIFGGNLKGIISGAAPCDPRVADFFRGIGISFLIGYGLTENSPAVASNPEKNFSSKSVGLPLENIEVKISRPNESGEGEIIVKGPTVMLGYFEDQHLTNETIKDGWLHTGDVGYIDQNGWLYVTGRIKNIIIGENGRNIYPEEIEELVKESIEIVDEVMVYSKKGQDGVERLTAKVKLSDGRAMKKYPDCSDKEEIYEDVREEIKKLNAALAKYQNIRDVEFLENDFERTTSMKVKRYANIK